jgi:outer membrane protein TolC
MTIEQSFEYRERHDWRTINFKEGGTMLRQPVRHALLVLMLLLCVDADLFAAGIKKPSSQQEVLTQLIAEAQANNPEIKASEERWRMSMERANQAGALEDPMMMLGIQNGVVRDPLDFKRDDTTAKVIGLSQKLPFYGKRDLMRDEAGRGAEAERWVVEERRLELRRMVQEAWAQLYVVDRSLETVAASIGLLDDLVRLAESMYSVGQTGQQEIFQTQLERSRMEEMRIGLQQRRTSLTATLNTLAHRPPEIALPVIASLPLTPLTLSATELNQMALANRPVLKTLQARIDQAGTGVKLAETELYPDFTVAVEYMQREEAMESRGEDMYTATLSFNLPVQTDRRRAKVAEMDASRRMAIQELAGQQNQIRLAISDALAQLERSKKLTHLYEAGMLDQGWGTLEATIAAYRTGKAKFAEVLASRMNLLAYERDYHGAVADYQMQLAILENAVGVPLPPNGHP